MSVEMIYVSFVTGVLILLVLNFVTTRSYT